MFGSVKIEKIFTCTECSHIFSIFDADRVCSNCFACTGCIIFNCPSCGEEVVIKPHKPMGKISD